MGLRSSKQNRTSYDVAPVVSDKDFSYKKHTKPLPKVELPSVVVSTPETPEPPTGVTTKQFPEIKNENEQQSSLVPPWVNKENFKKLLLKSHPNLKDISTFEARPALAAGENYSTLLLRIKATATFDDNTTQDFGYMLKVPHKSDQMQEMMQAMNFFITENSVYTEVIPEFEEMYREAGVEVSFGPRACKLDLDDPNIHYVLMQDLGMDGFKNANRLECLNMEHTLCVLRKMAQFHAASACRVAKKGAYSPIFSPDMDNDLVRGMMTQMFSGFKQPFLDNLKNFNDGEKYRDLMSAFFDNLVEMFIRARKLLPDYFSVLCHGDSWSNNILFKYTDDGKLQEALYVDFQNCNWGSPALDLYYFIISSVRIDIKLSQFDYFIRYYHEHLTENLKLLQYPLEVPNLREFHLQMIDFGSMATLTSFLTLGVVLLDPTDNAKFENFLSDSKESVDFKNAMYSNERYIKYINEILPWLYDRGFMEINLTDLDKRLAETDKLKESITEVKNQQPSFTYPEWVNESLFIDVVRADYENYQKIQKFDVSPATKAGDNYSSIMLKVDIVIELTDNSTCSRSYMLKIPPNGAQAMALISNFNFFEKEGTVYYDVIPQIEKVYKEQAGLDIVFAPKSYKLSQKTECKTIILENLKVKGFENGKRLEGLDMEHAKAALKKLAEFHAASAYLFETNGKFPEIFEHTMYNEESREEREKMTKPFIELFQECVEQYDNSEEYIEDLKNYLKTYNDGIIAVNKIDWKKFNVLNHGDFWLNNIMFQHDDQGNIKNTYFVDFQLTRYGSPVHDLYYFLLSSTQLELKVDHFDYFIRYYHENLKANLELLKYPKEIPSLRDLHVELLGNGPWAVYTVLGVMAAVLLEPSDDANLEQLMSDSEDGMAFKKQMFLHKRYRSHGEAVLPWLCRKGLLDVREKC